MDIIHSSWVFFLHLKMVPLKLLLLRRVTWKASEASNLWHRYADGPDSSVPSAARKFSSLRQAVLKGYDFKSDPM